MEFSRVPQEETDMHHKYQFSYMYTQVSIFWMMSTIWILSFLLDGGLTWWRYKISIKTYLLKFMRKYLRIRVIFSKMDLRSSFLSASSVRLHRSNDLDLSVLRILNRVKREQPLSYILLDFQQLFKELPFKVSCIHKGTANKHSIYSMPLCISVLCKEAACRLDVFHCTWDLELSVME